MGKKLLFGVCVMLLTLPPEADPNAHGGFRGNVFFGVASWYSELDPGINLRTASGEIFDDSKRTCASWHFPFGTLLRVTSLVNGKSVVCRVNDRGPARRLNRLIDLTKATFQEIAPLPMGLIPVKIEAAGAARRLAPANRPAYKDR